MGINELGHSVDSIFLDSTMASNCFQEHWQITDWLCVQVRELSVHSSKWRPSGKNVQRCKGQYLYEFLIFYPLRPMSRADFTQPRSFCLLFGDPLPPPYADVIYGSPHRLGFEVMSRIMNIMWCTGVLRPILLRVMVFILYCAPFKLFAIILSQPL